MALIQNFKYPTITRTFTPTTSFKLKNNSIIIIKKKQTNKQTV